MWEGLLNTINWCNSLILSDEPKNALYFTWFWAVSPESQLMLPDIKQKSRKRHLFYMILSSSPGNAIYFPRFRAVSQKTPYILPDFERWAQKRHRFYLILGGEPGNALNFPTKSGCSRHWLEVLSTEVNIKPSSNIIFNASPPLLEIFWRGHNKTPLKAKPYQKLNK